MSGPADEPFSTARRWSVPGAVLLPGGRQLELQVLQKEHLSRAVAMWRSVTSAGVGFAKNEEETEESLMSYNKEPGSGAWVVVTKPGDVITAVLIITPSYMCRSSRPVYAGGYFLIAEGSRKQKMGTLLYHKLYMPLIRQRYKGGLFRSNLLADAKAAVKGLGQYCVGVAPNCTFLEGKGWFDDMFLIAHDGYADMKAGSQAISNRISLPCLRPEALLDQRITTQTEAEVAVHWPDLHVNSTSYRVTFARPEDRLQVEAMIRDAADQGQGFALDEFTENGIFNRKFLRHPSSTLVCKDRETTITAAVLYGTSNLCRTKGRQVAGYIVVAPPARRRGLGQALLRYCIEAAARLGYTAIFTDVLASNARTLGMVEREGFLITATLPNTAIVRNVGYCDTCVVWRPVGPPEYGV